MDTDAVHLRLDELHGELSSGDQVHFVLPHRGDTWLCDSLCHGGHSSACAHQALQLMHGSHTSAYCPFFPGTSLMHLEAPHIDGIFLSLAKQGISPR